MSPASDLSRRDVPRLDIIRLFVLGKNLSLLSLDKLYKGPFEATLLNLVKPESFNLLDQALTLLRITYRSKDVIPALKAKCPKTMPKLFKIDILVIHHAKSIILLVGNLRPQTTMTIQTQKFPVRLT